MADRTKQHIRAVYDQIDFSAVRTLSFEAFSKGYYGYLNMQEEGKIRPGSLLTICDFSLSSNVKRMWVIDPVAKKVLFNTLVAHGQGTGEEFATAFSNEPESHQSSLGFYLTGETYQGNHGLSLKLHGVDGAFNSNAYERAIVIHAADYVCESFAKSNKRLGRSHGCPAIPTDLAPRIIDRIRDGQCLFIYHPSPQYLSASHWINSPLQNLPAAADWDDLRLPSRAKNAVQPDAQPKVTSDVPAKTDQAAEQACIEQVVSGGDRQNYRVDVKTIVIRKEDRANQGR